MVIEATTLSSEQAADLLEHSTVIRRKEGEGVLMQWIEGPKAGVLIQGAGEKLEFLQTA